MPSSSVTVGMNASCSVSCSLEWEPDGPPLDDDPDVPPVAFVEVSPVDDPPVGFESPSPSLEVVEVEVVVVELLSFVVPGPITETVSETAADALEVVPSDAVYSKLSVPE